VFSEGGKDSSELIQVLVTGGCGCLGQELVDQLLETGHYAVHCLDIFIPPASRRKLGVCSYIQTDIANFSDVSRALRGMEVVFHTAGLMPISVFNTLEAMERVNVTGTRNVVKACQQCGVKRLIYTSSCTVVMSDDPNRNVLMTESQPLPKFPGNAYLKTKGEAEIIVSEACSDELKTCALRLGGIVGGAGLFMKHIMERNRPIIIGKGNEIMARTTVMSAAHVHILAERYLKERDLPLKVFNVVSMNYKYGDLIKTFSLRFSGKSPLMVPMWFCKAMALLNESVFYLTSMTPLGSNACFATFKFITSFSASPKLAEKELGWVEKKTVDEIVTECIENYVED